MTNSELLTLIVAGLTQLIGLGIFIGTSRSSLQSMKDSVEEVKQKLLQMEAKFDNRLERIENKQDQHNAEAAAIRERVAVIENVIELKKKNA